MLTGSLRSPLDDCPQLQVLVKACLDVLLGLELLKHFFFMTVNLNRSCSLTSCSILTCAKKACFGAEPDEGTGSKYLPSPFEAYF